jgi:integrase
LAKGKTLTAAGIEKMRPPAKGQVDHFDATLPGFALRISAKGTKSFALFYRIGGRLRRLTLGRYPVLTLAEARDKARKALQRVDLGEDPRYAQVTQRLQGGDTFDNVAAKFVEKYARPKRRSWQETERVLRVYVSPSWGPMPIGQIARRDVIELLDRVMDENGPYMANRVLATVRKMFGWAMERDIVPANPCAGVRAPGEEKTRDRVLTDAEIAVIWPATDQLGYPFGPLVRLLLITGQRRDEVAHMRWSDLDLDNKVWTIPRERTKSDRLQQVPLSSLAMEVLAETPRLGDYVLSSGVRGDKPVSGFSVAKKRLDAISGLADWRLHDLRRTAASGMAKLNVPPHIIEKVLNHSTGTVSGVAAVYNRYGYLDEKRDALEAWASQVQSLLAKTAVTEGQQSA